MSTLSSKESQLLSRPMLFERLPEPGTVVADALVSGEPESAPVSRGTARPPDPRGPFQPRALAMVWGSVSLELRSLATSHKFCPSFLLNNLLLNRWLIVLQQCSTRQTHVQCIPIAFSLHTVYIPSRCRIHIPAKRLLYFRVIIFHIRLKINNGQHAE